ncbi:site-specific integrase [Rhodococcus sp. BP-149]|nr:site-specific integrase [Rhodococcus sp. BP-288]MBY6695691.1 site-specific integrase [Rhodococcus sp. BP-188]MBY6700511.1 site-specific integrase [Rhodococcus sp. BP-285]MBY6704466.1 site-specific integrase [Rhodococcus sp. BP-283]MBY6713636.1 site-specific integrase [Rhodococcus sp. BP-160]MBY6717662.1 site-specific integrase [Rhodococcus sp. BP-110]MBY6721898.1 site-specific integrase [Rhodococcus sp. BP-142]MBY6726338.1 site-specific integrase [Rhodococcus sp. BP-149]MBY6730554.1 site
MRCYRLKFVARQQLPPQIKKISVRDRRTGTYVTRYEVRVDSPASGSVSVSSDGTVTLPRRPQSRRRFSTEREARAALAQAFDDRNDPMYVAPSATTVDEACSAYLSGRHNLKPTTLVSYAQALKPIRLVHGHTPIQKLTKQHLDTLVRDLRSGSMPKSTGRRKPWKAISVNHMLNVVSMVLTQEVKQGRLVRDVAALVDRLPREHHKTDTYSQDEVVRILDAAYNSRVGHAWVLALYGLRRGEICGLRWRDVDFEKGTLTIANNRVSVNGRAADGAPKSRSSRRTLPLTDALRQSLLQAIESQSEESTSAGQDYQDGSYVVCDELGRAYHPDSISGLWERFTLCAEVRPLRLHDCRHSCGTLMHLQGVPIAVIAAWLGHSDNAFTMRTYVHAQDEAMLDGADVLQAVMSTRNPANLGLDPHTLPD